VAFGSIAYIFRPNLIWGCKIVGAELPQLKAMQIKQRIDAPWPKSILETHLFPRFGDHALDTLMPQDGLE